MAITSRRSSSACCGDEAAKNETKLEKNVGDELTCGTNFSASCRLGCNRKGRNVESSTIVAYLNCSSGASSLVKAAANSEERMCPLLWGGKWWRGG